MTATGKPSVNLSNGKPSHLVLTTGTADPFSASTKVKNPVTDSVNPSVTFDGTALWNKGGTPTRLAIVLKGKRATSPRQAATDDIPPTTGILTITLTSGPAVTPVAVDYVNDDT